MLERPVDRLIVFQHLNRVWRPFLSSVERDFLFYVLDRTVSWGKLSFRASAQQMIAGVRGVPELGLSLRTLRRVMADLADKGLIAVDSDMRASTITVNLDWMPDSMSLPVPKRLRGAQPTHAPDLLEETGLGGLEPAGANLPPDHGSVVPDWHNSGARLAQQQCQIGTSYIKNNDSRITLNDKDAPSLRSGTDVPGSAPLQQVAKPEPLRFTSTRQAVAAATLRPATPAKAKPHTTWTAWLAAWEMTFPDTASAPRWSKREHGAMATLRKRVEQQSLDWLDFVGFAVASWRSVTARSFGWMTDKPQFPAPLFLVRWVTQFLDAYAAAKTEEAIAASGERAEYRRLRHAGKSHDEALLEIGGRRALVERREELSKERDYVNRLYRAIERDRAPVVVPVAKRQPRLEIKHGDNPYDRPGPVDLPTCEGMVWEEDA